MSQNIKFLKEFPFGVLTYKYAEISGVSLLTLDSVEYTCACDYHDIIDVSLVPPHTTLFMCSRCGVDLKYLDMDEFHVILSAEDSKNSIVLKKSSDNLSFTFD